MVFKNTSVLIVGGGASGLIAAKTLAEAGIATTLLEAKNNPGGRAHTIYDEGIQGIAETGAEFVHGRLPVTLQLLKEAGIKHYSAEGNMYSIRNGKPVHEDESLDDHWKVLIKTIEKLETDITLATLFDTYFREEKYKALKESVTNYVQGYDTADISRVSVFALKEEWESEEDTQLRIEGGYTALMNYLATTCKNAGATIKIGCVVKNIIWKQDNVKIITATHENFEADKVIITVPLGVLQSDEQSESHIKFSPELIEQTNAIKQLGFGCIIKLLFRFKEEFWNDDVFKKRGLKSIGFIFSKEAIPTWWTQLPVQNGLLTGWLGGPKALQFTNKTEAEIIDAGITSLAGIFDISIDEIKQKLVAAKVYNWVKDEFTQGAYSYETVTGKAAKKILNTPIADTIFFAGEALYNGPETGTVEAAFKTGIEAAKKVLAIAST